jgi:alpha-ketoglutarate-dependent 2,4-dichlorophenoxyacetate dioxygenase
MPIATTSLKIRELHPSFACEITGVDLSTPPSDEEFEEIRDALHKYGVVVIPNANFPTDRAQIDFSGRFGEVEKSKYRLPYMRSLPDIEIFDISNLDQNGEVCIPVIPSVFSRSSDANSYSS